MEKPDEQKTISKPVMYNGIGLHSGEEVSISLRPSGPDAGIVFQRVDLPGRPAIPARIEWVTGTDKATSIGKGGAEVMIVEHVLAAIHGLGIDNLLVQLDSSEPPVGDGSPLPFAQLLQRAGIESQGVPKDYGNILKPIQFSEDGVEIFGLPCDSLKISFLIEYDHPLLRSQFASFTINPETFVSQLAPARTYCFLDWAEELRSKNLVKGGSLENAIVIGPEGILNPTPLRFPDEFVRHKIVDLLGDLSLLGRPLRGHIFAVKSGHAKNISFVKRLRQEVALKETFDISEIEKIMPHRYPILLVDKILELEKDRVVGIKNVTINEPFFEGHFPGHPIMPGVLIVEAMAQTGGFLLLHRVEDPEGKVVYITKINWVKFRKPVRPGDQLRSELKMLKFKKGLCVMGGKAWVEDEVVAEGEFTAVVVEK